MYDGRRRNKQHNISFRPLAAIINFISIQFNLKLVIEVRRQKDVNASKLHRESRKAVS